MADITIYVPRSATDAQIADLDHALDRAIASDWPGYSIARGDRFWIDGDGTEALLHRIMRDVERIGAGRWL